MSKFKVGQVVRIVEEITDDGSSYLSESSVAIGDKGVIVGFRESSNGFNVDVQLRDGEFPRLYFKEEELEAVDEK